MSLRVKIAYLSLAGAAVALIIGKVKGGFDGGLYYWAVSLVLLILAGALEYKDLKNDF